MSSAIRGLYLPPAVLSLADLSWPARLVLAEILDLHKVNGQVWANDQHFVNRLPGLGKRTVGRALKELADGDYLVRDTNQSAQHKRILTPAGVWAGLVSKPSESLPIAKSAIGSEVAIVPIADLAIANPDLSPNWREPIANLAIDLLPNLQEPIANLADINYTINTKGNNTENPAANAVGARELSENPSPSLPAKKVVPPVAKPPRETGAETGPGFDDFWQAYGKKLDLYKCQQRWRALTRAEQTAAMAHVPRYVAATPEKRYRKNPLTYLNGRAWLDEDTPEPTGTTSGNGPAPAPARAATSPTKARAQNWS